MYMYVKFVTMLYNEFYNNICLNHTVPYLELCQSIKLKESEGHLDLADLVNMDQKSTSQKHAYIILTPLNPTFI